MKFTVSEEQAEQRLDLFISEHWDEAESRTDAQRSIKAGDVSIDGTKAAKPSFKISEGQVIQVSSKSDAPPELLQPTDIPIEVVYEDADIAVINKPIGLTVHPGAGHVDDTLANGAVARWPHIATVGETDRPGIVHRLDKDTSGLMVLALSQAAYESLQKMIWDREITRIYSALVHGIPDSLEGVIDAPIGRDIHARKKQVIDENGRASRTHYKVQYQIGDFSFLEVRLETGRMHQIRVHLTAIGHAVAGDQTYGKRSSSEIKGLNRQFLHASKLEFAHPISGEPLSISSELPDDLQRALESLSS